MSQTQAPETRLQLLELIARLVGWGATTKDVEDVAEKMEAEGVSFIPTALIPNDILNPYRKGLK